MMTSLGPSRKIICFGEFEADLQAVCLFKHGEKIRLRHQLSTVLAMLLERVGEVVPREDIQKRLWPGDIFVDFEINLNTLIARLREVLGDSAESPRYIETLPKRGYRFLAPASEIAASESLPGRRIRLVVLPLSNAGWDPAEEFFGDEMTEEIITALCQAAPDHLAVIARTTALQYRHSDKDVAAVGRELEVEYVVEGGRGPRASPTPRGHLRLGLCAAHELCLDPRPGLGEFDEVLKWIERAIEDRDSFIIPIKTYPCLDPLRSDPRFLALVRKMNLEP